MLVDLVIVLGMYLVSLRPGTGNQFPGTPADQPVLESEIKLLNRNNYHTK